MAENTSVEPQKAPTAGSNVEPWELFKRTVKEEVMPSSAKGGGSSNPWEGFRDSRVVFMAQRMAGAAKKRFKQPEENKTYDFESVFNNLIQAESGGRHYGKDGGLLTSPVGARGITQIMPETARTPGYGIKPIQDESEEEYLRFGRDYLKAMVKKYNGDFRKAIASYNAGAGNVDKAVRAAKRRGGDWIDYLPKKSETIPYMDKILGTRGGRYGEKRPVQG